MIIKQSRTVVDVQSPAKLNLYLDVLGKRADGFHEIETILCPVNLFDRIRVERCSHSRIELELVLPAAEPDIDDPAWRIPGDEGNLVVRAARRVQTCLGTTQGCHIRLEKNVPAAAGLGGGSSNAAATITACLLAWGKWDRTLAHAICCEVGSDVPFFLGDQHQIGLARASGRGERCATSSIPPAGILADSSTSWLLHAAGLRGLQSTGCVPRAARKLWLHVKLGKLSRLAQRCSMLYNRLQQARPTGSKRQLDLFSSCGVAHALMSGSGSSCFALIDGTIARFRAEWVCPTQGLGGGDYPSIRATGLVWPIHRGSGLSPQTNKGIGMGAPAVDITEVRIKLMEESEDRLRAFCSITLDNCFVVRDLKIIEGSHGPFVAMPSRKLTSRCARCGNKNHIRSNYCNNCGSKFREQREVRDEDAPNKLYADVAHPINQACRDLIQQHVVEEYGLELERAKLPGYVSRYDDAYESTDAIAPTKPKASAVPPPHLDPRNRPPVGESVVDPDRPK